LSKKTKKAFGPMTQKNVIYPVFLPHAGCPFQCVYCNQRAVTSTPSYAASSAGATSWFREQFNRLLDHARERHIPGELAFYGGTFTALPPEIVEEILETAAPWVKIGIFSGLRFSTRPDGITEEICSLLGNYPIETIELGAQSLADEVLIQSRRGYSSESVMRAATLVRERGWRLGLQMMPGLPGDSSGRFLTSIAKAVELRPNFVRIYPTLVLVGTQLAEWFGTGRYVPLSLDEAISWCVPAYELLFREQIPIARLGLHPDPELQKPGTVLAGPFHPAFGYLVRVHWWRERLNRHLQAHPGVLSGRELTVYVGDRFLSEVLGPHRSNVSHWQEKWRFQKIMVKGRVDQFPGEFETFLN
jgi:histone acetyltransferase (RNA polymerase elongator complex component)